MIFKTFDSKIDKWTSKIGIFGKSFNELGTAINEAFKSAIDNLDNFDENVGFWESLKNNLFSKKADKDWIKNSLGDIISKENIDSYIAELDLDSAKNKLKDIFDWDDIIQNSDKSWQDYFGTLDNGERYIVDLIKNTDDLSKLTGEDLVKANQQARASAIDHNEAIKAQTFSAKAGKVALGALTTVLNAVAFTLIAKGIEAVTTKLHNMANESETAKEKAESFASSVNSLNENISGDSSKLSELNSRYQELSKGVNILGENVSLSTGEYGEYKDIISQVSGIMPGLTTYFNAQGEKIGFVKGKLADLNDEYERTVKENSKDLFYNGDEDGNTVQDSIDNINHNKKYGWFENAWNRVKLGYSWLFHGLGAKIDEDTVPVEERLNALKELQNKSQAEAYKYLSEKNGNPLSGGFAENSLKLTLEDILGYSPSEILDLSDEEYNELQDKIAAKIEAYSADIESDISKVRSNLILALQSKDGYWETLDDEQRNSISTMVSSLNSALWDELNLKTPDDFSIFADKIIENISTNSDFSDAWKQLFGGGLDNLPVNEYVSKVRSLADTIGNAFGLTTDEQKNNLLSGLGFDNLDELVNNYDKAIKSAVEKWNLDDSQKEELEKFFEENSINTEAELDAWRKIAQEAGDPAEAEKNYLQSLINPVSSLPNEWNNLKTTDNNELRSTREDLLALAEAGRLTEKTFHETAGADTFLGRINESLPETIQWINKLVSSSNQLASMKKGISSISSALGTKKSGRYVDADTLNGFSAEIKGLESWEEFEQLLGSSESSMKDCRKAANRLASEYVNSSNFLSNLNEENQDYYITQLANMGISNAREVVEHELENTIRAQEYATILLADSKYNLIGVDAAEQAAAISNAQTLLSEGEASEFLRMRIFQLVAQEQVFGNQSLDVNGKISALSALASAYLTSAQAARIASYAEHLQGAVEHGMPEAAALESYKSFINSLSTNPIEINMPKVNTPTVGNGISPKGNGKGPDSQLKSKETKTSIDWIDRRLTILQKKLDATKAKFENLFSVKKKAKNLDKQIKETTALLNASEKAAKQYKKRADKIKLSEDRKKDKDLKKKVREGNYSIRDYSQETADKINKYKDYYDKYKDLQKQTEELEKQKRESEEEKYQLYVDNAEAKLDRSKAHAELDEGNYKEQNRHLEKQKQYLEDSYKYQIKIARLNHDKVEESKLRAELEKQLRDLTKEEFDNIAAEYENKIGFIEGKMDIINSRMEQLEAKGYVVSKTYYNQLISQEAKNLAQLKKERDALQKQMDKGLKDGSTAEGTTSWYEMLEAINEVDNAIIQTTTSMTEYKNQLRQLEWDAFDRMQERISQIQNEAGFLSELMENKKLFDEDNGQWTAYANAAAGLHAVSYNTYMAQADDYAEEIRKISRELASDPYNTVLAERRQELINAQQEAIRNAESEKQSIRSLVSDGYDVMLDALQKIVDKRKELLDSEKNLYDYEKKISDQAKNVLNLEKQKLSVQGDDSEEAKAKLQQITLKLEEARSELEESEYDQWRSDQDQVLDKLTDDVKEWVNQRLDNTDGLVSEVISSANANAADIHNTLEKVGNDVGYLLTDEMQRIWDTDSSVVAVYGDSFHTQLTSVNSTLVEIRNFLSAMQQNSEWESLVSSISPDAVKNAGNKKNTSSVKHTGSSSASQKTSGTFTSRAVSVSQDSKNGSKRGESFVPVRTGETSLSTEKMSTIRDAFKDFSPVIDVMKPKHTPVTPDVRTGQNNFDNVNVDITLPNVKNYDEFVSELSKDRHFEKVIQSMTLGNALGRNSFNKFRV